MRLDTFADFLNHFINFVIFPGCGIGLEALADLLPEPIHLKTGQQVFHDLQILRRKFINQSMQSRKPLFICFG